MLHLRHPVLKIRPSIVVHATGGFSVRNVQKNFTFKVKGKLVCQWTQICRNCSFLVTSDSKHECFKKFCSYSYPQGTLKPCLLRGSTEA
jgi:rRNA maturation endonuclease Nob1